MSVPIAMLLLLLGSLIAIVLAVVHTLATMLLRPPRMNDGKALYTLGRMSPGDLGLPFEPVSFTVRDEATGKPLTIAAWWIAADAPSSRTCVIIHGFADAKVGALAWAPVWRELGWNLLLIDLRAHGESGGAHCTGGFRERDDVGAVLDQLRAAHPRETKHVVLFGISLGGAVALATGASRTDIDAVIADSVFADYGDAAITHGRLIGAPLPRLIPAAIRWAEWLSASRFAEVRPVVTIGACPCPVMLIHGDTDRFVPDTDVNALASALAARGEARDLHVVAEGAGHCLAIVADEQAYAARLDAFLSAALKTRDAAIIERDGSPTRA